MSSAAVNSLVETCYEPCPIEHGMRVIGGKWTGTILWHLRDGPLRFNALARQIEGASRKMLTQRLKQLEADGLITRVVVSTEPFHVEYNLSPRGQDALGILEKLKDWTHAHYPQIGSA